MTSKRQNVKMSEMASQKRSTVYFDSEIHRALRMKAAASDRSISEIVNDAVRDALSDDADDLEWFDKREREPTLDFAAVVAALRRRGKI